MSRMTVKLTGQMSTARVPGPVDVPTGPLPVKCPAVDDPIGDALLCERDGSMVDVRAMLRPMLWLFGGGGLVKYPNMAFAAWPRDGVYWICEVWLCRAVDGEDTFPYAVITNVVDD